MRSTAGSSTSSSLGEGSEDSSRSDGVGVSNRVASMMGRYVEYDMAASFPLGVFRYPLLKERRCRFSRSGWLYPDQLLGENAENRDVRAHTRDRTHPWFKDPAVTFALRPSWDLCIWASE